MTKNIKWLAILAAAGAFAYATKKASDGAKAITTAANEINPVNENNILNRGVTSIVENATDGKHVGTGALGSWLYCQFNDCTKYERPTQETLKQSIGAIN